ncbi:MAG: HAMP domain-containing protein [Rugosibacter sp.]|nr:MAG: HAMP domain-containing protein [Rugosibacter sp.]
MKLALILAAALAAVLLFLLAFTSGNTAFFAQYYPWLLAFNGLAALGMLVMVTVQLIRLRRDFKAGIFGARLKSRLLVMLALMAVLPGALVYAVSMQFAVNSIDSWFDVRVDQALEGGLELGRSVLDNLQDDLLEKTRRAALELGDGQTPPSQFNHLREQMDVDTATLLTLSGQVVTSSADDLHNLLPPLPSISQLRSARNGRGMAFVSEDNEGLMIRTLVPVVAHTTHLLEFEPRILQLTQRVPMAIAKNASNVEAGYRNYQELQLGRSGLKRIYTLTLTLTLMLALFAAVALAFLLAEHLAQPLLILAEGTRAVSAGDFTPRTIIETSDELGLLTRSFNNMTRQLSDARAEANLHREKTEAAQAYLESVLGNLSAGVLAFSPDLHLRAANRGALTILQDELVAFEKIPLADWPRHQALATAIIDRFTRYGEEWQQQLDLNHDNHAPQTLLIRGTALPTTGGGGFVVVFDDITRLISAQRSAAWAEVAQRLAHEIKNPLTPIQLSAERLQMKLSAALDGPSRALLERATNTIITQVEALKNMVNDFRDYARTPPPQRTVVNLRALVIDVLALYENTPIQFTVSPAHPEGIEKPVSLRESALGVPTFFNVLADANQLRQVLHNLFANAQDALANIARPRIDIRIEQDNHRVRLTLHDNGTGFSPQMLARAFEPYVTTKTKGTGLGLAIVKKIIDDHGGEIRLANHDGGGEVSLWLLIAGDKQTTTG